jgi:hypothetical protein
MEDEPGFKTKCPPIRVLSLAAFYAEVAWLMTSAVFPRLGRDHAGAERGHLHCTTVSCARKTCGVIERSGPWEIAVAMREEITQKRGTIEAIGRSSRRCGRKIIRGGFPQHSAARWAKDSVSKHERAQCVDAALRRLLGRPARRQRCSDRARALMQAAGEDFVVLGAEENACGLYAAIWDFATNI